MGDIMSEELTDEEVNILMSGSGCGDKGCKIEFGDWKYDIPEGQKDDEGKVQWSLLPWDALEGCVRVFEFGCKKYGRDNWKGVPNGKTRYSDALMRHMTDYMKGYPLDEETGLTHLDHILCNALFLKWMEMHINDGR
jgi:hypothetical protein